jgi:hypothetical protein
LKQNVSDTNSKDATRYWVKQQNYLNSFTESDPVWNAAAPNYLQKTDTNTVVGTKHNLALKQNVSDTNSKDATRYWVKQQNYLNSFTESDPVWNAAAPHYLLKTDTNSVIGTKHDLVLKQNVSDTNSNDATRYWVKQQNYLNSFTESDPVWNAAAPNYLQKTDTNTVVGTKHDLTLKQNVSDTNSKDATRYWVKQQNYLNSFTESDPVWNAAAPNYLQKADTNTVAGTKHDLALKQNVSDTNSKDATRYWVKQQNYLNSFTESDPVWNAAAPNYLQKTDTNTVVGTKHDLALKQNVSDTNSKDATRYWVKQQNYLNSFTESDPVWNAAAPYYLQKNDTNVLVATQYWAGQTFAPKNHNHLISSISNLQDSLNNHYRRSDTSTILLSRARASHDYEFKIVASDTTKYWRGDKTWQTLNSSAVGLGNVTNNPQVTSVGGTSPIVSTGGTSPVISISPASSISSGSMSSSDYNMLHPTTGYGNILFYSPSGLGQDANLYWNSTSHSLGIGMIPSVPLEVSGSSSLHGTVNLNSFKITNLASPASQFDAANKKYVDELSINLGTNYITNQYASAQSGSGFWTSGNGRIDQNLIVMNGSLGIGTSNPAYRLDVFGTARFSGSLNMSSNKITNLASPIDGNDAVNKTYANANYIQSQTTTDQIAGFRISGNGLFIGGKIGIGTTMPNYSLDINGDVAWSGTLQSGAVPWGRLTNIPSSSTLIAGIVQLSNSYSGSSQLLATTEKALSDGLGTKASTTHSHAAGDISSGIFPVSRGGTNTATLGTAGTIPFSNGSSYAFSTPGTTGRALVSGGNSAPTWFAPTQGSLIFSGASGVLSENNAKLVWDNSNFRLAIGKSSPLFSLDVVGDVAWSGTLQSGTVPWARLNNVPIADTTTQGIVILTNDTSGNSTTLAVTQKALSKALHLINLRAPTWHSHVAGDIISGIFPISRGGTNASTIGSAGSIPYSNGSGYVFSVPGTSGRAMISGGTGAPSWFAPTQGSILFSGASGVLAENNIKLVWDNTNFRLGIGKSLPLSYPLDVVGDVAWTGTLQNGIVPWARLSNVPSASTTQQGIVQLSNSYTGSSQIQAATEKALTDGLANHPHSTGQITSGTLSIIRGGTNTTALGSNGQVVFSNGTNYAFATNFFWDSSNGLLGIGKTNPSYPVDIVGDIAWTGTLQSGIIPWARLTNVPIADTVNQGIVILTNDTSGNSSTMAVTQKALSKALHLLHLRAPTWHSHVAGDIISGIFPIARGGTNTSVIGSAGSIPYSNGSAYLFSAVGTTGRAMISGGTGAPSWFAPTQGSILFSGASGVLSENNLKLVWDNSNFRLGIGKSLPLSYSLDVVGDVAWTGTLQNGIVPWARLNNVPSASTGQQGIVQLSNSYNGTSQVLATTEKALTDGLANHTHSTGQITSGTLPIIRGGTNTTSIGSLGQIAFSSGNSYTFSSQFNWDYLNDRLGIGTATPSAALSVGNTSQFQVASTGKTTITCSLTPAFSSKNTSTSGVGVMGIANNTSYTGFPLIIGGGTFLGTDYGVFGQASLTSGERGGGFFRTDGSAYAKVGGYNTLNQAKLIWGVGTVGMSIQSSDGLMAEMSVSCNPETVITDYGVGVLQNGKCTISIDPVVAKRILVNDQFPLKVFIQLEGDCNGVYVTNKSANGFDVIELMGGKSNVPFSWTFTANMNDIVAPDGRVISKNLGVRAREYPSDERVSIE